MAHKKPRKLIPNTVTEQDLDDPELLDLFRTEARAVATRWISVDYQGRISPTVAAASAVRSARSEVRRSGAAPLQTDLFQQLVRLKLRRKVADQARRETAKKRDRGKERTSSRVEPVAKADDSGLQAIAREHAQELLAELLREESEVKRLVNVLGHLCEYSASMIREVLENSPALCTQPPSLRAIQLQLAASRQRVSLMIGDE